MPLFLLYKDDRIDLCLEKGIRLNMKVQELLNVGIEKLKKQKIEEPILKSRILLAHILKIPKETLILQYENTVQKAQETLYLQKIQELANNKPLQYITNKQEFMKLIFYVDENVLIPRADTEILVEEVIKNSKDSMEILDLCTGSGAIAVSLAKYTKSTIYASDISRKALEIATRNANDNKVFVHFILSDMFENIINKKFDIIVSNPPYIETETILHLDKVVQKEPRIALDGGNDGLKFYKIIAHQAKKYLKPNGMLYLEIGYNQKQAVIEILQKENYKDIYCQKDLNNKDRVIVAKKGE